MIVTREHHLYRTLQRAIGLARTETELERIERRIAATAERLWSWEVEWLETAIGDRRIALLEQQDEKTLQM